MSKKRSPIWRFFDECILDPKHAVCKICDTKVSRGSDIPSKRTTKLLDGHLEKNHPTEFSAVKASKSSMESGNNESVESPKNGSYGYGDTKISNLKTKAERSGAMSATVKGWIESRTKIGFNSDKGLAFHKSIFEWMIMDLQPFSMVNDLGFQRHHQQFNQNYQVRRQTCFQTWKK